MRLAFFVCVFGVLASRPVFAQGNDLYGPGGGRSALMGNTGVALARDGAAPFYNPATIVRILDEKLAFSANFYSFSITDFDAWHAPETLDPDQFGERALGDTSLQDSSFRSLPSSLCLFLTLEELALLVDPEEYVETVAPEEHAPRQKLALCFASIESEDADLQAIRFEGRTAAGPTTQVQSLQRRWNRFYIGPTYSVLVNEDFALGGSLQAVYSYTSFGISGSSLSARLDASGVATSLSTSGRGRSFDLTAVVGATYRYRRLTFGASVRAPAFHLVGSYEGTASHSTNATDLAESTVTNSSGSFRAPAPVRLAFGTGLTLPRVRLELDGAFSIPVQNVLHAELDVRTSRLRDGMVDRETSREEIVVPAHIVFNPSAGGEYFLSSDFSLMAGLSANFSSLSELRPHDSAGNVLQTRAHHLTASIGLGSYWEGGELLFGFQFDYGWGSTIAIDPYALPNAWSVVDARSYTITFVISGSASLRALARVVDQFSGPGED